MQKVIWRTFFDFEKEEAWINEMADKGLSLVAYSPLRYVFEKTEACAYQYKIELLDNLPSHPESETYLEFLEENGMKVVATSIRWVFLQKTNDGLDFELNSTIKTKIKLYERYLKMIFPLFVLNFIFVIVNGFAFYDQASEISLFALTANGTVSLLLGFSLYKFNRNLRALRKEAIVYDG